MKKYALAFLLGFTGLSNCYGYTTVSVSTAAVPNIERDFIAATTTQFKSDFYKNPLASNTFQIKLIDKNEGQSLQGNAFDSCIAYGFANGMDEERKKNMITIISSQQEDLAHGTCAGFDADEKTAQDCQYLYYSIINKLCDGCTTVYTSTGAVTNP